MVAVAAGPLASCERREDAWKRQRDSDKEPEARTGGFSSSDGRPVAVAGALGLGPQGGGGTPGCLLQVSPGDGILRVVALFSMLRSLLPSPGR